MCRYGRIRREFHRAVSYFAAPPSGVVAAARSGVGFGIVSGRATS
jgi:hypothetical protein